VKAAELRALREGGAAAPATRKKPGKGKPEEEKPSPFAPPLVVNVPPSAWSDVWVEHPKEIVKLGLRRITADALLAAHVEAAKKADEYLPDEEHESALWQITQQTIRLHIVLCYALTDPTDYRSPPGTRRRAWPTAPASACRRWRCRRRRASAGCPTWGARPAPWSPPTRRPTRRPPTRWRPST
jgi:hypothetical protein